MFVNDTPTRTAEEGHTKACLAYAVICAVENLRDQEDLSDVDFVIALQDGQPLDMAYGYLADGLVTCTCPPLTYRCEAYDEVGMSGPDGLVGDVHDEPCTDEAPRERYTVTEPYGDGSLVDEVRLCSRHLAALKGTGAIVTGGPVVEEQPESRTYTDLDAAAAAINAAFAEGKKLLVDGHTVKSYGRPARVWGTGSLSVDVATKNGRGVKQYWVKPGQSVTVTTEA